jgi:hypothetical protein
MTRLFWSVLLIAIMAAGGWAIYAGAQELVAEVEQIDAAADPRYQFIEHFYVQTTGVRYEVFLRLDRETGQTWRFHAGSPVWTPIFEEDGKVLPSEPGLNRYELMAHEYRDSYGQQQELFLRVDYVDGQSWKYRGMAANWEVIPLEFPSPGAVNSAEKAPDQDDTTAQFDVLAP